MKVRNTKLVLCLAALSHLSCGKKSPAPADTHLTLSLTSRSATDRPAEELAFQAADDANCRFVKPNLPEKGSETLEISFYRKVGKSLENAGLEIPYFKGSKEGAGLARLFFNAVRPEKSDATLFIWDPSEGMNCRSSYKDDNGRIKGVIGGLVVAILILDYSRVL